MAVELRRLCGWRKVNGLYLCGSGSGEPCGKLPLPLTICPTCGRGIKQARGWTWIDLPEIFLTITCGAAESFYCKRCPLNPMNVVKIGRAGLLWIGESFYKTTGEFIEEANRLGISRRISAIPRKFELGKTWVCLAHPKAVTCPNCKGVGWFQSTDTVTLQCVNSDRAIDIDQKDSKPCPSCMGAGQIPGIFRVFCPDRIEKIITDEQAKDPEVLADLEKKGLTPVIVPAGDPDHQSRGSDELFANISAKHHLFYSTQIN
jgi:hypothetical protein